MSLALPPPAPDDAVRPPLHGLHATPLVRRPSRFPGVRRLDDLGARDPLWRDIETHVVDVQRTPVVVRRHRGADPRATPHLLLHGLGASSTVWLDTMPLLAAAGDVVAVDLPGFGRTPPPAAAAARVPHLVNFVVALLDRLGWERAIVHGSSMGGLVTALLSARRPDLVQRQVLLAPGIAPPERRIRSTSSLCYARFVPFLVPPLGKGLLRWAWESGNVARTHDTTAKAVFGDLDRLRPAVRDLALENLELARELPWRVPAFAEAAESLMGCWVRANHTWREVLSTTASTLVVWGDADRIVHGSVVDHLEANLRDVVAQRWAGVGHTPMQEQPGRYAQSVLEWLAS